MAIPSKELDFKTYLVSYNHVGARWVIELKAASEQDARQRLGKLVYGKIDGELMAAIPVGLGLLARVIVGLRNALGLRG